MLTESSACCPGDGGFELMHGVGVQLLIPQIGYQGPGSGYCLCPWEMVTNQLAGVSVWVARIPRGNLLC